MKDDTFFRGIRGPVGSGKSVGCCVEVFRRALAQQKNDEGIRRSRWAIIRNTNRSFGLLQLRLGSIGFQRTSGVNSNGHAIYTPHSTRRPRLEYLLALDRPEDVKLLSLELTGIWINEAREIPKSIMMPARCVSDVSHLCVSGRVGRG